MLRFTSPVRGSRREMGLGGLRRERSAGRVTLRRYTREYHGKQVEPVRSFKHAGQWINSIEQHVPGVLMDTARDLTSPVELLDALVPILREVPETGSRIYQRLATVFDAAAIEGLRRESSRL